MIKGRNILFLFSPNVMRFCGMRTFLPFFIIGLLLAGVCSVNAITWGVVNPIDNSKIYTDRITYTIDYTNVSLVPDANTGFISINIGSGYVNYTATVTNTTASYHIERQDTNSGNDIYYIWYIGNETNIGDVSGVYTYTTAKLYGVFMVLRELPTVLGDILGMIVWIAVFVLVIGVVGWLKGWFGKGGFLGSISKMGLK